MAAFIISHRSPNSMLCAKSRATLGIGARSDEEFDELSITGLPGQILAAKERLKLAYPPVCGSETGISARHFWTKLPLSPCAMCLPFLSITDLHAPCSSGCGGAEGGGWKPHCTCQPPSLAVLEDSNFCPQVRYGARVLLLQLSRHCCQCCVHARACSSTFCTTLWSFLSCVSHHQQKHVLIVSTSGWYIDQKHVLLECLPGWAETLLPQL